MDKDIAAALDRMDALIAPGNSLLAVSDTSATAEGARADMARIRVALTAAPGVQADWTQPTTVAQRLGDAVQLLCGGKRPPEAMVTGWLDHSSEELQSFCAEHGPSWAQGIGLIDAAMVMVDQPTEITTIEHPDRDHEHRAPAQPAEGGAYAEAPIPYGVSDDGYNVFRMKQMLDFADATHALRASHGQAAAAPKLEELLVWAVEDGLMRMSDVFKLDLQDSLERFARRFAAPTAQPAPAAEQVAWESTTPAYTRYVTQARYEKFSPAVRRWYKPYKCSSCEAPAAGAVAGPSRAQIRDVFLANGFTVKEGQTDLKPYVYEAAEALLALAAAPSPAATPTAASLAWNVLRDLTDPLGEDGAKIMGHVRVFAQRQYDAGLAEGRAVVAAPDLQSLHNLLYTAQRTTGEARENAINAARIELARLRAASPAPAESRVPEYVGNGMFKGETIQKAAEHWANWCDRRCMDGLAGFLRVVAAAHTPAAPEDAKGGA